MHGPLNVKFTSTFDRKVQFYCYSRRCMFSYLGFQRLMWAWQ